MSDRLIDPEISAAKFPEWGDHYKESIEDLWKKYRIFAPSNFKGQFCRDLNKQESMIWEMILACKLLDVGYKLKKTNENSPDLCVSFKGKNLWIECSLPRQGDPESFDSVPDLKVDGCFYKVNKESSLLRIANVIKSKERQYNKWIDSGIISKNDVFIYAVNGLNLQLGIYRNQLPDILGGVYGTGTPYGVWDEAKNAFETGFIPRLSVRKRNGKEVPVNIFIDKSYGYISGVIYSNDWICRSSTAPEYCFVRNLNSSNPSFLSFENICQAYDYTPDEIKMKKAE